MMSDKQDKKEERERPVDEGRNPGRSGHSGSGSGSALKQLKKWERMRATLGFKPRETPSKPGGTDDPPPKG